MGQPALDIAPQSKTLAGFSVAVRHDGPATSGVCQSHDDFYTRLLLDGWIREGAQVELTFTCPDGSGVYEAIGHVRSAPPNPGQRDRYAIAVDLLQLPRPVKADRLRPEPHTPPTPLDHYRVSGHMKAISGELSTTAVDVEVTRPSEDVALPMADSRSTTPAFLQPDRQSPGEFAATVRFRRPETFVGAYEEQILEGGIIVQSSTPIANGVTVRIRFTLPHQSIGYAAVGRVRRNSSVSESGVWVKLAALPAPTRRAFETAYATFAPERAALREARRGWAFWRR